MAREAELFDGTILEFPDETPDDVIATTAKRETERRRANAALAAQPVDDAPGTGGTETFDSTLPPQPPVPEAAKRSVMDDGGAGAAARVQQIGFKEASKERRALEQETAEMARKAPSGKITPLSEGFRAGQALQKAPAVVRGVAAGSADLAKGMWGLVQAAADLGGQLAPGPDDTISRFARAAQAQAGDFAEATEGGELAAGVTQAAGRDQVLNEVDKFFASGARGLTANVPAMALGGVLGRAAQLPAEVVSLGTFGVQAFGTEYGEGVAAGKHPGEAFLRALPAAAAEIATELLPTQKLFAGAGAMLDATPGRVLSDRAKAAIRYASQAMLLDIPGEQLNTIIGFLNDKLPATGLRPDATAEDLRKQLVETLYQTLAQGVVTAGTIPALGLARRAGAKPPDEPLTPAEKIDIAFRAGGRSAPEQDPMMAAAATEDATRQAELRALSAAPDVDAAIAVAAAAMGRPNAFQGVANREDAADEALEDLGLSAPPAAVAPPAAAAAPATGAVEPAADAASALPAEPNVELERAANAAASSPQNDRTESPAQIEANNRNLGHYSKLVKGLDLSIENPEGSTRRDIKNDPPQWEVTMRGAHYGYIKGTKDATGEHVDVFVSPNTPDGYEGTVFVVDQIDPATGKFDEPKVMIGYADEAAARATYAANFSDGSGPSRIGAVTAMPMPEFRLWLREGGPMRATGQIQAQPTDVPRETAPQQSAAPVDRRRDAARRKRIDEMTPAEKDVALRFDEKTGALSERAYHDAVRKPTTALLDVDSLKWVNDEMGYAAGDELLRAIVAAVRPHAPVYRIGGDEFVIEADTPAEIDRIMAAARDALAQAEITYTTPDGEVITYRGLGVSYGKGADKTEAEDDLAREKASREQAGTRAARGERPANVARVPAAGRDAQGADAGPERPVEPRLVARAADADFINTFPATNDEERERAGRQGLLAQKESPGEVEISDAAFVQLQHREWGDELAGYIGAERRTRETLAAGSITVGKRTRALKPDEVKALEDDLAKQQGRIDGLFDDYSTYFADPEAAEYFRKAITNADGSFNETWFDAISEASGRVVDWEAQQQEDEARPRDVLPDPDDLDEGMQITIDVMVADTGKTSKMTLNAADAVRDLRKRQTAVAQLIECLR